MLELDRQVAAERRIELVTVEASMDDMPMLAAGELRHRHPSGQHVLRAAESLPSIARWPASTRPGGLYISQHKSPTSLQADIAASPARL